MFFVIHILRVFNKIWILILIIRGRYKLKFNNKILILAIVLLAMVSLTAVSAADDIGASDDSTDALSVSSDETIQLDSNDYNKTVYVDSQGDDSGAGTEKSPYASLNKAISLLYGSDKLK